ncbi:MAG: MmgE/PrpD family protein [Lawsonibacter sp.]|nr:MmgE/PrpD family protein [Lawsonibacter sp.]
MAQEIRKLAHFVRSFHLDQLPDGALNAVKYCVLDNLGAALGAASSQEIAAIGQEYLNWCGTGSNGKSAAAWCQGYRTSLSSALLLNGMMAHDLELDDVHTGSKSHVGAVVIPTAWTVADAIGADGRAFLEAVIVGYEVMSRVGLGMDVASNRKRGWHTTGVIGTFGAAAAAARLLDLSEDQIVSAFGMAGTQSSGLWAFLAEGSTCKKLHPARAATNGLSACFLAQSGMTGPEHILDAADGGLYQAVSDRFDMAKICQGLGQDYAFLAMDKKPYPCCRTTHHAIDAALQLHDTEHLHPEDIASVLVETYDIGVLQCGFSKYPETPVEAKFSIPFTCAVAFVYGQVSLREFSMETIDNPEVARIAKATRVVGSDLFTTRYPKRWGSRTTVTMADGQTFSCQIDDMSGSVSVPLSARQEQIKFLGLAEAFFSKEAATTLMDSILKIETFSCLPDLSIRR